MKKGSFISQKQFNLIAESEAKFILDHAEKQVKDLLDTSLLIVNRSTTLLTIVVGLMVGLVGFWINKWEKQEIHHWDELLFTVAGAILYLLTMAFILVQNFLPRSYLIPGAELKDFFEKSDVFNPGNKDYRLTAIYINEIVQAQVKIDFNKTTNEKRWKSFRIIIYMLSALPFTLGLLYYLSTLVL